MPTKSDAAITLTPYNPDNLLDAVIAKLNLKNDAALCRHLDVPAPLISKIRHRKLPVGASLLIRMHEATDLSIGELRSLIETPSEAQHYRHPKPQQVTNVLPRKKASLEEVLTGFSTALDAVREPLRQIALLQRAQERYPDHEERSSLMAEYRRLLDACRNAIEGHPEVHSSHADHRCDDNAAEERAKPFRRPAASGDIAHFAAAHPLIKELFHCLHATRYSG